MDQFVMKHMPSMQIPSTNGDKEILLQFLSSGNLLANGLLPAQPAMIPLAPSVSTLEKVEGMIARIEGESPPSEQHVIPFHNGTLTGPTTVGEAPSSMDHPIHNPLTVFPQSGVLTHPIQSARSAFTPVPRRALLSPIVTFESTMIERPPPSETPAPQFFEDRLIKTEEPGDAPCSSYQSQPSGKEKQTPFPALAMATEEPQGHHFPPPSSLAKRNTKYKKSRRDSQAHLLLTPPSHSALDSMSQQSGDPLGDQAPPTANSHPNLSQDNGSLAGAPENQPNIPPSTGNAPPRIDGPYTVAEEDSGPLKITLKRNPAYSSPLPPTRPRGRPPKNRSSPSLKTPSTASNSNTTPSAVGGVHQPQQSGSTTSEVVPLEDLSVPSTNPLSIPPYPPPPLFKNPNIPYPPYFGLHIPDEDISIPFENRRFIPPVWPGTPPLLLQDSNPPPSSTNDDSSTAVSGTAQQPQQNGLAKSEESHLQDAAATPTLHHLPPPPSASDLASNVPTPSTSGHHLQPIKKYPVCPPPPPPPRNPSSTNTTPPTGILGDAQTSGPSVSTVATAGAPPSILPHRPLPPPPPNAALIDPARLHHLPPPPPPPPGFSVNSNPSSAIIGAAQQSQSQPNKPLEGVPVRPPSIFPQVPPNFYPQVPPNMYPVRPAPVPTASNPTQSATSSNNLQNPPWCLPQTMTPSFTHNNFSGAPGAAQHPHPWGATFPAPIPFQGGPIPVIPFSTQGVKDAFLDPDENLVIEWKDGRSWTIGNDFLLCALDQAVKHNPEKVRQLLRKTENLVRAKKRQEKEKEKEKQGSASNRVHEAPPQNRCTSVPPSTIFNHHQFNIPTYQQASGVSQGLANGYGHNQNSAFMMNPMAGSLGAASTSTQRDRSPFTFNYNREEEEAERKKELNERKRTSNMNGKETPNKKKK